MKKKKIQKRIAWLLSVLLIVGVFPTSAFAAETDETAKQSIESAQVEATGKNVQSEIEITQDSEQEEISENLEDDSPVEDETSEEVEKNAEEEITEEPMETVDAANTEHTREEAVQWVHAQEGKSLDYDGAYGAQCVDLIKYYYAYFGKASYARGNGCDYVSNALPDGWIRIKNTATFVPEPGDIAVWGTELSKSGHVAIILSADVHSFVSMDQNWPSGSPCKQVTHTYSKFWGVIRPSFAAPPPQDKYYNSYGFDNPVNNETITEKKFLFQGWVDTNKEISSITCSINHGAHYVATNLYNRPDVPNAVAFRAEADSNLLNLGENDIALCVNFADGTGKVLENRTVTWAPKLLYGFDSPSDGMRISDNQFQFSGWIETAKNLEYITCSLNHGEQYLKANLYSRPDVPNAVAFRLDIGTSNLHYGENYIAVCAHYADGTGEPIAEHKVIKNTIDVVEYPQNDEKFDCNDSWFLLQGWSVDDEKELDHFEFTINESKYETVIHTRPDLSGNARYYREEVPLNRLKDGKNQIEIFACYKDGTIRNIGQRSVLAQLDHEYDEGKVSIAATCTKKGEKTYTCIKCQKEKKEEIPAAGHKYENGICSVCGEKDPDSFIAQGKCGENVSWYLNKNAVLTITGKGNMANYTYVKEVPWYSYSNQISSVEIQKGVTSISDYAFYGLKAMNSISIPEGVTTIGAYAFKNSTKLVEVNLPSTLKKLGESAFYGCSSLKSVSIPEGIYTIWAYTFKNCTGLEAVNLPESLIKIEEAAFYGCSSLKKIEVPAETSIIGIYCFKNCRNLSEISLPKSMTRIREAAFYGTAITEITIPNSVTSIGAYAFKNCTELKEVKLSKALKEIGDSAFYACSGLTALNLPDTVTDIKDYAFRKCTGLKNVNFSAGLKTIGESSFYGCENLTELNLPEGVTDIKGYAFKGCTGVTEVTLPTTLKTIGESAFYACSGISRIEIPKSVTSVGDYGFSRCTKLSQVSFKGNAPAIGANAFAKVSAKINYPSGDVTWSKDKQKNYGGTLSWSETK